MQNKDTESRRTYCNNYIWLGLQHMVQMSLLWRIWIHWNKLHEPSHEDKRHHQKMFHLYKTWTSCQELYDTRRVEDEKKAKSDNIRKQMKQQWIPKSPKNASLSHEADVTQELGDTSISN